MTKIARLLAGFMAATMMLPAWLAAAEDEAALDRQLTSPRTSLVTKDQICQKLKITGTTASVPALASLLNDENLSQSARLALETMPFPQAGAALREALAKTSGKTKAGIIDSLGERRDAESVDALSLLLDDADAGVASSAALALGKIGGEKAVQSLRRAISSASPPVRAARADAMLRVAERMIAGRQVEPARAIYRSLLELNVNAATREAAYRGVVLTADADGPGLVVEGLRSRDAARVRSALRLAIDLPGRDATVKLAAALGTLAPEVQVHLLETLEQRGDVSVGEDILLLLNTPREDVRLAAAKTLGILGDASAAVALAELAARTSGADRETVRNALASLRDPKTGDALLAALPAAAADVQTEIARALGRRRDVHATPALLKMASGEDGKARAAALRALAAVADGSSREDLLKLLVNSRGDDERDLAGAALLAACERSALAREFVPRLAQEMKTASASRGALLRIIGRLHGDAAMQVLRQALHGDDAELRAAALQSLADDGAIDAADELLKVAVSAELPAAVRITAQRGYWRIVSAAQGLSAQRRWEMCQAGLAAASRVEEKRLGLSAIGNAATVDALNYALSLWDDPQLSREAQAACLRISLALRASHPDEARSALRRLGDAADEQIKADARAALEQADRYAGYIDAWTASGPYRQAGKRCRELFDIPFAPEQAGGVATWSRLPVPADAEKCWQADLLAIAGGDQCVVYVRSRVWSPAAQKVRLAIGSDDGIKLWVNGRLVHANNTMRPLKGEQDAAHAELRQGWNDVLAKITQNDQGCGVCVRIRDEKGGVIEGLKFDAREK